MGDNQQSTRLAFGLTFDNQQVVDCWQLRVAECVECRLLSKKSPSWSQDS